MALKSINKKGDPTDMLIVVLFAFVLAVCFTIYFVFTSVMTTTLHNSPMNITETQTAIQSISDSGGAVDSGYIFIIGGMILGIVLSSFWVREHPAYIPLYIIFILVSIVVAALLSNAYVQTTTYLSALTTPPTDFAVSQPLIYIVMTHAVRIALVVGVFSMIICLGKVFSGQGGGGENPL